MNGRLRRCEFLWWVAWGVRVVGLRQMTRLRAGNGGSERAEKRLQNRRGPVVAFLTTRKALDREEEKMEGECERNGEWNAILCHRRGVKWEEDSQVHCRARKWWWGDGQRDGCSRLEDLFKPYRCRKFSLPSPFLHFSSNANLSNLKSSLQTSSRVYESSVAAAEFNFKSLHWHVKL